MVPVLTLLNDRGRIDARATAAYAKKACGTWIDYFIVSGTLGLGMCTPREDRLEALRLWLEYVPSERIVACAWHLSEVEEIRELEVTPMVVLRDCHNSGDLLDLFSNVPRDALIYSHPRYSPVRLDAASVSQARALEVLPKGAKISKVGLDSIRSIRQSAGPVFDLYDGRCRHIEASLYAGATGVVAAPLAALPEDLPVRQDLPKLQSVIDEGQALLDRCAEALGQAAILQGRLRCRL